MLQIIAFIFITGLLIWKIFFPVPKPILGIYSRSGKRGIFKQWFMYLLLKWRKRSAGAGKKEVGYGLKMTEDINKLECVKELGPSPLAVDAVLFSGGADDGTYLVISAARRADNILQCIVMILVPGVGLFEHTQHPDTTMYQKEHENGWVVNGIHLEPLEAMKKWKVQFEGEMMMKNEGSIITLHKVKLDAVYTSDLDYFDFDSDMEPWTVARAMSREPWSREYFEKLKDAHQSHYEQFGDVLGKLSIDGTERDFKVNVMRDHTHGSTRDWTLMHRYCLHNFTCRNGIRGFLGIVSQPGIFSFLELGYIYNRQGKKQPIQEVDFPIWDFGENGSDSDDYGFKFKAGDKWYHVHVDVQRKGEAMFGLEWEARVVERFCRYTINGVDGWGVSEWEYRHKEGNKNKISSI